jgi:UDP-N-acetylmuramoyl-L-alanyl-D-glutamate--2,6-diaminopimelate ligase
MHLSAIIEPEDAVPGDWADVDVTGLTADSREVAPGSLFAAMPGTQTDGAKFIADAIAKGAVAVIGPASAAGHVSDGAAFIETSNVRRAFARAAARFYGTQPEIAVAVTGTNGKTSVASFVRQIWQTLGHGAASIGTVGVVAPQTSINLAHTTPDPVVLHRVLHQLAGERVQHVALEVSSHGLAQHRTDGVRLAAAAFTNITRDHLDYHASFEDYFAQKMRLFSELLPEGASAVVNADSPVAADVTKICADRRLPVLSVGERGETLRLAAHERQGLGYALQVECNESTYDILLPLVGDFQISNALVAAGLVIATGSQPNYVLRALERLRGAKGRMDLVVHAPSGAPVFVDFAHTPDALENALSALRPYAAGRLVVVFGCGGDRDRGKRPQMGDVAVRLSDLAIVTDDNPRTEDASAIRAEIMAACPDAIEIGDRADAIAEAVKLLRADDILVIAGKGHESGQEIDGVKHPFSDHEVARLAIGEGDADG